MATRRQINAGRLDQLISIQQRTDVDNGRGEPVPTWVTLHADVWAQREPLRGRDYFAASQTQTPADVRFRIRYRTGITPLMRVVHNGQPYEILGEPIDVDGQRQTLELMCASGVRDGRGPVTDTPPTTEGALTLDADALSLDADALSLA